jgi:tetratricopeptide (TPR) repeat protein
MASNADNRRVLIHYRLGWESVRSEAWEEAAKQFQQAIYLDKKFKLAYYGLGRADMGLKRFDAAAKAYEMCRDLYGAQAGEKFANALEADLTRQDDQLQLKIAIDSLANRSKGQTAVEPLQIQQLKAQSQRIQLRRDEMRSLSIESTVPGFVSLALGSAYFRMQRFPDAEQSYKAAIENDPTAGEPHNNLAVLYMLTDRLEQASSEVKLAEKTGFRVNPQFKLDLEAKRKGKL